MRKEVKKINISGIDTIDKYQFKEELTREQLEKAFKYVLQKIDANLDKFTYKFPAPASGYYSA